MSVTKLQNLCGYAFILMFALQFVFQSLIFFDVIQTSDSWYAYIVGFFSVIGFFMLYRLASTVVSDFFALSMFCFELFFMMGRPFMLAIPIDDYSTYLVIFGFTLTFSLVALYMWTVLFNNFKFTHQEMSWLIFLPLPFVVNVIDYGGHIMVYQHLTSISTLALQYMHVLALLRMILSVAMPFGYWLLSHSRAYAGRDNSHFAESDLLPFNRYFLAYFLIVAIILFPLNIFS